MTEKKAAIIDISNALAEVSFLILASVGGASGNLVAAGLTAFPAAAMKMGLALARLKEKKEAVLELDVPKWWTSDFAAWKGLCNEIVEHLPHILEEMATQLQKEQGVVTTPVVNQTFINVVANEHLTWEYNAERKREVAIEIAPPVLKKVAEELKAAIDPIRQDMALVDVHNTAVNTAKMIELLENTTSVLENVQKQGIQPAPDNTSASTVASSATLQAASVQSTSPDADIQRKIASDAYDVYICYDEADETEVREIGEQLRKRGILPWFDTLDDIDPAKPRVRQQQEQIEKIPSAAMFIGDHAIASEQALLMYEFIRQFVERGLPVMPVLLKSAPLKPKLPPFWPVLGGLIFISRYLILWDD